MAKIGIIEDDDDLRDHLCRVIDLTEDLAVAFSSRTLADAIAQYEITKPDLCLIDIDLPDGSGLDLARLVKRNPATKALILTVLGDKTSVLSALGCGADGYLLKDSPSVQIAHDIRLTLAGDTPISPHAARHLLSAFLQPTPSANTQPGVTQEVLTARELEVLHMFAKGLSYAETSDVLKITRNTVSAHVKAIYSKLGVNSGREAIYEAQQLGLLH